MSRPYWARTRAEDPPGPAWRDWLLVVAVAVVATVEAFTAELVWPGVSLAVTVGLACLLPWRRVRPLLVFVVSFGTVSAVEVLSLLRDVDWEGLDTSAFLLVLPYALRGGRRDETSGPACSS